MQKTISCAIIDDEPLAVALLASYVEKIPFLTLSATYPNAVLGLVGLQEKPVDLLYLDIQMPNLSGLELAKVLPPETRVIFTTAFSQYAVDSYKVNALDYLLKPISYADFLQSATKALRFFESQEQTPVLAQPSSDETADLLYIKTGRKLVQIRISDILYVESQKDYVRIVFDNDQDPIESLMSLKTVEEMLPTQQFMRVHRSFIVQKMKIREVESNRILFGQVAIPVGDIYRDAFNAYLSQFGV